MKKKRVKKKVLLARCQGCKKMKPRSMVKSRSVYIPNIGQAATSHLKICPKCAAEVQKAITPPKEENHE